MGTDAGVQLAKDIRSIQEQTTLVRTATTNASNLVEAKLRQATGFSIHPRGELLSKAHISGKDDMTCAELQGELLKLKRKVTGSKRAVRYVPHDMGRSPFRGAIS